VNGEQAQIARQALRKYGKGRHAAALNFGGLFSYALAKVMDQPLLFKGNDFSQTDQTDIEAVPLSSGKDDPTQSAEPGVSAV
jgi:uncharacterized protein with PIN domain